MGFHQLSNLHRIIITSQEATPLRVIDQNFPMKGKSCPAAPGKAAPYNSSIWISQWWQIPVFSWKGWRSFRWIGNQYWAKPGKKVGNSCQFVILETNLLLYMRAVTRTKRCMWFHIQSESGNADSPTILCTSSRGRSPREKPTGGPEGGLLRLETIECWTETLFVPEIQGMAVSADLHPKPTTKSGSAPSLRLHAESLWAVSSSARLAAWKADGYCWWDLMFQGVPLRVACTNLLRPSKANHWGLSWRGKKVCMYTGRSQVPSSDTQTFWKQVGR